MAITTMTKVNFWNTLRVDRNIRYKDLHELFGECTSKYGGYFSGQLMPADEVIQQLCDFFDVEFDKGKEEFKKAHEAWKSANHKGKRELITGKKDAIIRASSEGSARISISGDEVTETVDIPDVFSLVYGKLPYKEFTAYCDCVASKTGDPLKLIYGVVSYEEYNAIAKVLGE